ncbi:MAG: tetratricopeptide repeat protein [Pyrinomonadaceae bacterium]
MQRSRPYIAILVSSSLYFAFLPNSQPVYADLVATESIAGGSSVFVFRESQKKQQLAGGRVQLRADKGRSAKRNSQIAAAAQKRRALAIANRKKASATANAKIARSNVLTTTAEKFLDDNQADQAITNFRAALVQNPKNARATDGLSNALTAKGIETAGDANNVAAIPLFEEAAKLDKQNDVAYAKLGAIYDAKGDDEKAITNYEKALAINPEYTLLYPSLGIAYLGKDNVAKGEDALAKSEKAGIDSTDVQFLRGLLYFKQNKNDAALAAFDKAIANDARFVEAQYYRGRILDRQGRQDQAIAAYKQTVGSDPTFAPASFDLGVAYYNKGDYTNAIDAYQQSAKYDTGNSQTHANLASSYRQLGLYPEANAEYKTASTGMKTPELYSEWGYCLGQTAEWDKSVERLNTAAELSPTAADNSNVSWAYYNSGKTKTAAKDEEGAKVDFGQSKTYSQKAVTLDPKLDAAYLNLGSTHNALGEYQLAVNVLNTAVSLNNNWVIAMNQLGYGYRGLNDLTNAVAIFKRAVDLDGKNTYGLFNLGEAYHASGNKNEAKKINDRLRKINPKLAASLDNIFSGKAVLDNATRKIDQKIPKIKVPRIPF